MESLLDEFNAFFTIDLSNSLSSVKTCQRLRYQVYCEETNILEKKYYENKMEIDSYDCRSSHALLIHNHTGLPVATVRVVLPISDGSSSNDLLQIETKLDNTYRRILWNEIGADVDRTAEITRFIVSNNFRRRKGEQSHIYGATPTSRDFNPDNDKRLYPFITIGLFKALLEISSQFDLEHWVAAMEPGLIRLLTRFGIRFQPLGPQIEYYGRRQPCYGSIRTLANDLYAARPEIWRFATNYGRYYSLGSKLVAQKIMPTPQLVDI